MFTIIGATAGATIILNNLAALVDKVLILRSHWLSNKEQEERLRSLKIANNALEAVVETFKKALDAEQEQIVDELAAKNNITDNFICKPLQSAGFVIKLNVLIGAFSKCVNRGIVPPICIFLLKSRKKVSAAALSWGLPASDKDCLIPFLLKSAVIDLEVYPLVPAGQKFTK